MQATALSISRLTVRYGPTTALDGADLEIGAGQVHALLGENGAGKSTIVKVLSRLWARPNAGGLAVFGHNVARFEPRYANALGIRTAFQEISLVKDLTVAQNFMLMEEPLNALGLICGGLSTTWFARGWGSSASARSIRGPRCAGSIFRRGRTEIARAISGNPRIVARRAYRIAIEPRRAVAWRCDRAPQAVRDHHRPDIPSHAGGSRLLFGHDDFPQRPDGRRLCDG